MDAEQIIDFIHSLPLAIDNLSLSQAELFCRRHDGPNAKEDPFEDTFKCFVSSIRSIRCSRSPTELILHMKRSFTREEVLSGMVSRNIQSFLWGLGYVAIGAGTWDATSEPKERSMVECILFLDHAFRSILPPVRSLQSLTYEAFQKDADSEAMQTFADNPTMSLHEGLELTKECSIPCHFDLFLNECFDASRKPYSEADKERVMSYYFTTCLASIEKNVIIQHNNTTHTLQTSLLFQSHNLAASDMYLDHLLRECFRGMGEMSRRIYISSHNCDQCWGLIFSDPILSHNNKYLIRDVTLTLIAMEGAQLRKCFYRKGQECRDCCETEGSNQACITFLFNAILSFWHEKNR